MKDTFSSTKKRKPVKVGNVRQSQLVNTFGIGSIVDFVNDTVMISGVDSWTHDNLEPTNQHIIYNENLQSILKKSYFVKPKASKESTNQFSFERDIQAVRFPETMYCKACKRIFNYREAYDIYNVACKCPHCQSKSVVPSSFVVICEYGHIEEFPYSLFVHSGKQCQVSDHPRIKVYNIDHRSDIDSLIVECEDCNKKVKMTSAFNENAFKNIKNCESSSPWLKHSAKDDCKMQLKTRMRLDSSIYFPITISALSIPPWSKRLFKKFDSYYKLLIDPILFDAVVSAYIIPDFPDFTISEIRSSFGIYRRLKTESKIENMWDMKFEEFKAITGREEVDGEFSSKFLVAPAKYNGVIKKIVAIEKLTEVVVFYGFSRLRPVAISESEYIPKISNKKLDWLPAIENHGEGIFIEFDENFLNKWGDNVGEYYSEMKKNYSLTNSNGISFSPQYVFLHTFSHLLMSQMALYSGYSVSSIKERIYCGFEKSCEMFSGVLIYTSSPDADGSLGGLVKLSNPKTLEKLINDMLVRADWCSLDPFCSQSYGASGQGVNSLNYAACHACTLLPETSCENRNILLDRCSIIGNKEKGLVGVLE